MNLSSATELRAAALAALMLCDPQQKVSAVRALAAAPPAPDPDVVIEAPPGLPGRPPRPVLVPPRRVPSRSVGTLEGRAALLHAVAHIEHNAIGLALDALWRFPALPDSYYQDWLGVACEEALHFDLLCQRLHAIGFAYGDFPAHDGLWEMANKTAGDVLVRMAIVPRVLEARGLDASPLVREKLLSAGDRASAAVIDVILRDEIGHVAIGNVWFRWLCTERELDPRQTARQIEREVGAPVPKAPLNLEARRAAGFDPVEFNPGETAVNTCKPGRQ